MGRIKVYEVSGGIGNAPAPALSNAKFSASDFGGAAIGDAIKTASSAYQMVQKKKLSDERVDAVDALNKFQFDLSQYSADQEKKQLLTGGDARDHVSNVMNYFEIGAQQIGAGTDPKTQDFIRKQLGTYRNSAFIAANSFGAKAAGKHRVGVLKSVTDGQLSQAYTADTLDQVDALVSNFEDAARTLGISGKRLDDSSDAQAGVLSAQAVKGIIDRSSPDEAKRIGESLRNGTSEWLGMLAGKDVDNLAKYARTREAAGKGAIKGLMASFNNTAASVERNHTNNMPMTQSLQDSMKQAISLMPNDMRKEEAIKKYDRLVQESLHLKYYRGLSLPSLRQVASMEKTNANQNPNDQSAVDRAIISSRFLKQLEKESKDPVEFGITRGSIATLGDSELFDKHRLEIRRGEVEASGQQYGVSTNRIYSAPEVARISEILRNSSPAKRAELAKNIVSIAGADWPEVIKPFLKIEPSLAVMASLAAYPGNEHTNQLISAGADVATKNNLMANLDHRDFRDQLRRKLAPALSALPGDVIAAMTDAVYHHYIGANGYGLKKGEQVVSNIDKVDRSISAILGHPDGNGIVNMGSSSIPLPPDVSGDDLEIVGETLNNTNVLSISSGGVPVAGGRAIDAGELFSSYTVKAVPGGEGSKAGEVTYAFVDAANDWVADSLTGGRFTITLSDDLLDSWFPENPS